MNKTYYPKILIIGQTFNYTSGSGITKSNLFKGWPKNRLAVATQEKIENNICNNYYQLGYTELKRPWPFNYLQEKIKSGPVYIDTANENKKDISLVSSYENLNDKSRYRYNFKLKKIYHFLLHLTGVYNKVFVSRISDEFLKWFEDFNPDIIYDQLSSLSSIRFLSQLYKITKKPYAVHIMDDWISTVNKFNFINFYWKRRIEKEFVELINNASVLMSICQGMSDEYENRYEKKFIPFHNPVEIDNWIQYSKTCWDFKKPFKILYSGRIGRGTMNSIVSIAKAVDILSNKGFDISFQIQTTSIPVQLIPKINKFKNTIINPPIAYNKLPEKYSSMDLLVLPMDFDHNSLKFIRLSMPTKTSEYMATGTPILVYAPECTALYKYAKKEGWAYVVSKKNQYSLVDAIMQLYSDIKLRQQLGIKSKYLAKTHHDAVRVREDFRKILASGV